MAGNLVEFEFSVTFDREVPEWGWREKPWKGIASMAAVGELRGHVGPTEDLKMAAAEVLPALKEAAAQKVRRSNGSIREPVVVGVEDL